MAGLQFSYRQLDDDLRGIEGITRGFVHRDASHVFAQLKQTLQAARTAVAGTAIALTIPLHRPLRTALSQMEYERAPRRGKHRVIAEVSATWELAPIGAHAPPQRTANRIFELAGNASVLTCIRETDGDGNAYRELARWHMDIGVHDSPGCHFHVSVLGHRDEPPFPRSLSVPRFPSFLITIGDALEFVMGEIFQTRWAQHAAEDTPAMVQWRRSQQERVSRIIRWQQGVVTRATGAPWAALKAEKPADTLFTEEHETE